MTIDISKIKPGDKVTLIPLEVMDMDAARLSLQSPQGWWIAPIDLIAAHHPAPREFQVGDRVRFWPWTAVGTVRGTDQDEVWVKWDENTFSSTMLSDDLTLVEAGQ